LDALATQLKSDTSIRVQLQAYAAGTDETAPDARRLSLSRALKVRSHLIDQGVRSTRMDVRALGVKAEGGPPDRVDAVVVRR
jgi:outer membrane protein OmpA-like peptidoglycan-associated protein